MGPTLIEIGRLLASSTRILRATDRRIKKVSEVLRSIYAIKTYVWELAFENKIIALRQ
jgi:hypothetical protein